MRNKAFIVIAVLVFLTVPVLPILANDTCLVVFEWTVVVTARIRNQPRITGGAPGQWRDQNNTYYISTANNNPREAEARAMELFKADFLNYDIENIRANARPLRH